MRWLYEHIFNLTSFYLQMMVDAVLEIMQKAVVPWTNVVEKLVQQYLEMEGPKYVFTLICLQQFIKVIILTFSK